MAFQRRYRVDAIGMYLADYAKVSGAPKLNEVGVATVTMPRDNRAFQALRDMMKTSASDASFPGAYFPTPVRVFTLDEDGEIIPQETFYLEQLQSSDFGFDDATFTGHYCGIRLADGYVPPVLAFQGETEYLDGFPHTPDYTLGMYLDRNQSLYDYLHGVTLVRTGAGLDSYGHPLKEAALKFEVGTTSFLAAIQQFVDAKLIRATHEEDESGLRVYISTNDSVIDDRTTGPNPVVFVRGQVVNSADRTEDGQGIGTDLIVRGGNGTIFRARNEAAYQARVARDLGAKPVFESKTDIYDQATCVQYTYDKLPYVTTVLPKVSHSELRSDQPGTPIPNKDVFTGSRVISYTEEGDSHEFLDIQGFDQEVVDNGSLLIYSTELGRNERDIRLRSYVDPNKATTNPSAPPTVTPTDLEPLRTDLTNLDNRIQDLEQGGAGGPEVSGNDGQYTMISKSGDDISLVGGKLVGEPSGDIAAYASVVITDGKQLKLQVSGQGGGIGTTGLTGAGSADVSGVAAVSLGQTDKGSANDPFTELSHFDSRVFVDDSSIDLDVLYQSFTSTEQQAAGFWYSVRSALSLLLGDWVARHPIVEPPDPTKIIGETRPQVYAYDEDNIFFALFSGSQVNLDGLSCYLAINGEQVPGTLALIERESDVAWRSMPVTIPATYFPRGVGDLELTAVIPDIGYTTPGRLLIGGAESDDETQTSSDS